MPNYEDKQIRESEGTLETTLILHKFNQLEAEHFVHSHWVLYLASASRQFQKTFYSCVLMPLDRMKASGV